MDRQAHSKLNGLSVIVSYQDSTCLCKLLDSCVMVTSTAWLQIEQAKCPASQLHPVCSRSLRAMPPKNI
ncbi:hypothetical protein NEOLEDRAFT_1135680 [Neolentinus lepideus HHB14362 ss-1]|uniref:Uncharacterized protein n=1 Tax=Neolentinus lepideus HHB14362 ss-1 TaxID=1314782 RepID=A0A165RQA2_9AGAM|nr:hypothetical protein NEOLEDRAFT_1135680 [Neolentinus lepideus HHB14362 ss-1]